MELYLAATNGQGDILIAPVCLEVAGDPPNPTASINYADEVYEVPIAHLPLGTTQIMIGQNAHTDCIPGYESTIAEQDFSIFNIF